MNILKLYIWLEKGYRGARGGCSLMPLIESGEKGGAGVVSTLRSSTPVITKC
jgi:hypothetical protein